MTLSRELIIFMAHYEGQLSDHDLMVFLAHYLESQAPSSHAALILHQQLGPKLARIIAGESPRSVLHTAVRGRPVSDTTLAFQSAIADTSRGAAIRAGRKRKPLRKSRGF